MRSLAVTLVRHQTKQWNESAWVRAPLRGILEFGLPRNGKGVARGAPQRNNSLSREHQMRPEAYDLN